MRARIAVLLATASVRTTACPIGLVDGSTTKGAICSGNGHCAEGEELDNSCACDVGFTGADCSQRVCPAGRAWADYATANQTAHAEHFECSNMGYCDRASGECVCREGFIGAACDRMACQTGTDPAGRRRECSGQGRCLSMGEAAAQIDYVALFHETSYAGWDADMIRSCVCDAGYGGYDCSQRICPFGDDPISPGVDEVQLLECRCSAADACNGTFALTFRGQRTDAIPYDATPELLEYFLERLSTVTDVDVKYYGERAESSLCDAFGTTASITFLREHGNLPGINVSDARSTSSRSMAIRTDGESSSLHPSVASVGGTKEDAQCSNRGICEASSGLCSCYAGFQDSDGLGGSGTRGDCGHFFDNETVVTFFSDENATWGPCPKVAALHDSALVPVAKICSGKGECQSDRTCNCSAGYEGPACEFAQCPTGRAWFDEALFDGDAAHANGTECSNRGLCDRSSGECECDASWNLVSGPACNQLSCAMNNSLECSGYGTCATMAVLATEAFQLDEFGASAEVAYTEPWDAHMVRQCHCLTALGEWPTNTSDVAYRGPFAYAYTDFTGYTCGRAFCPTGDNPDTFGENEVQKLNCTGVFGAFSVTFRDAPSVRIPWYFDAAELENALESLPTLRNVTVTVTNATFSNSRNASICGLDNDVTIEFVSERGDLPLLLLDPLDLAGQVNVSEVKKGTKEDLECAQQGLCDRVAGRCECLDGMFSGADQVTFDEQNTGAPGQRGDCSFKTKSTKNEKWYDILNQQTPYAYTFAVNVRGT